MRTLSDVLAPFEWLWAVVLTWPRMMVGAVLAGCLFLSGSDTAEGGWYYSSYSRPGYSWYNAGYYGTSTYHYAGYYHYEQPQVIVAQFVQYIPTPSIFATYNPQALAPAYVTNQLAAVGSFQQQAVQQTLIQQPAQQTVVQRQVGDPNAAYASCHAQLQALDARLRQMELLVNRSVVPNVEVGPPQAQSKIPPQPEQKQAAPQATVKRATDGLGVLANRCGSCHEKDAASVKVGDRAKGGDKVLLDSGKLVELTAGDLNALYRQLLSGRMPPKGHELAEGEGALLMQYLEAIQATKKE